MSRIEIHIKHSMENIMRRYAEIYKEKKGIIDRLIPELHAWFDYFDGKRGVDYDYSGIHCIKHREQRHHIQGISEAKEIFTRKYGDEFGEIIEQEAKNHIMEDMDGHLYFKEDYKRIGFWKELRGF